MVSLMIMKNKMNINLIKCFSTLVVTLPLTLLSQIYIPPAFDMSGGSTYILNSYNQSNTAYPPNMAIRFCGDCNQSGNFTTELTAEAEHRAGGGAGQWRGENDNGVSVRGGTNKTRASFLMILNTTTRSTISVNWTVRDIVTNPNTNYIELQWRIGGSGDWNNVSNDLYQQGTTTSGTIFNITLPTSADNQSDLRIRWIYYETGNGARDRLAIDDILISSDAILPLEIVYFDVWQLDRSIQIQWIVSDPMNIDYFRVEESLDGLNFYSIQSIPFNHRENQLKYSYTHATPGYSKLYYRINQVDFDGQSFYTDIKNISVKKEKYVQIYPTIAKEQLFINLTEKTEVLIIDSQGRLLISKPNLTFFNVIDISKLISGKYYIKLVDAQTSSLFTFIKL